MKIIDGTITSPYGWRIHPITKIKTFHNGIDIGAAIGTEIYSPCDGEIKQVYTHPGGGLTLIIGDKDNTLRFGFCHLSKIYFAPGTKITRGSLLALSGNTGKTTGPHLHFTVKDGGEWKHTEYIGGEWINPVKYTGL